MLRTNSCGELSINNLGEKVTLCGWVQKKRDLGGMTFIDLRDSSGTVQITIDPDEGSELYAKAETVRNETVNRAEQVSTRNINSRNGNQKKTILPGKNLDKN